MSLQERVDRALTGAAGGTVETRGLLIELLQRGETDAFVRICDASKTSSPACAGWPKDPAVRAAMERLHSKGKGKANQYQLFPNLLMSQR